MISPVGEGFIVLQSFGGGEPGSQVCCAKNSSLWNAIKRKSNPMESISWLSSWYWVFGTEHLMTAAPDPVILR